MLTHLTICFLLIQLFRFLRKKKNKHDLAEDKELRVLDDSGDEAKEGNIQRGKQPFFEMHFSDN